MGPFNYRYDHQSHNPYYPDWMLVKPWKWIFSSTGYSKRRILGLLWSNFILLDLWQRSRYIFNFGVNSSISSIWKIGVIKKICLLPAGGSSIRAGFSLLSSPWWGKGNYPRQNALSCPERSEDIQCRYFCYHTKNQGIQSPIIPTCSYGLMIVLMQNYNFLNRG